MPLLKHETPWGGSLWKWQEEGSEGEKSSGSKNSEWKSQQLPTGLPLWIIKAILSSPGRALKWA